MRPLGICVLGAGDMGNAHLAAWNTIQNVKLVAVADIDEEAQRFIAPRRHPRGDRGRRC